MPVSWMMFIASMVTSPIKKVAERIFTTGHFLSDG
jgi:hypothetical protein